MKRGAAAGALLAALALGGCRLDRVREHPLGCRAGEESLARDTLYFGRALPDGGDVDDAAWRRFEDDVLAPAFPRGYSVVQASGHWRGADGQALAERSRIVIVVHADNAAAAATVRDVAVRYRALFRQESVLRERGVVCATF
jgi:uncharacterized protein DUF3574